MEKKQTAVEFIEKGMEESGLLLDLKWLVDLIKQAKEMEKEQIMDAYEQGESDGYKQFIINIDKKYQSFVQYYNETYVSKVNDECYFEPTNNTSSATICKHCGKEKSLHTIT